MSSKNMNKIVATISIILILITGIYFIRQSNNVSEPGEFELIISSEDQTILFQEMIEFEENDVLYDVLRRHFSLNCASKTYEPDSTCSASFPVFSDGKLVDGKIILGIEGDDFLVMTDWNNTFLAIEVYDDGRFRLTSKGVSNYHLTDGEIIRIIVTRVSGW